MKLSDDELQKCIDFAYKERDMKNEIETIKKAKHEAFYKDYTQEEINKYRNIRLKYYDIANIACGMTASFLFLTPPLIALFLVPDRTELNMPFIINILIAGSCTVVFTIYSIIKHYNFKKQWQKALKLYNENH